MDNQTEPNTNVDEDNGISLVPVDGPILGGTPAWVTRSLLAVVAILVITALVAEALGKPIPTRMFLMTGVFLFICLAAANLRARTAFDRPNWQPSPKQSYIQTSTRLICYGDSALLERLALLRGDFAEPYIVRRTGVRATWSAAFWFVVTFAIWAYFAGSSYSKAVTIFGTAASVSLYCLLYPILVPTYYRITPGRLETLAFSFLSSRGRVIDHVNLLKARVTCRCDESRIKFEVDEGGDREVSVNLAQVPAPREFVEAVFNACLCKHKAPALPADSLLG